MSSNVLMPFTTKPGSSFAGALPMSCIERCDPIQFDSDESDESTDSDYWVRFPVCTHSDGMEAFLDVCIPSEREGMSLSPAATYRLLCHVLIQHLPDVAFGEALEALKGMYEFYGNSPALLAPPLPLSVKATVTGSYTAPSTRLRRSSRLATPIYQCSPALDACLCQGEILSGLVRFTLTRIIHISGNK